MTAVAIPPNPNGMTALDFLASEPRPEIKPASSSKSAEEIRQTAIEWQTEWIANLCDSTARGAMRASQNWFAASVENCDQNSRRTTNRDRSEKVAEGVLKAGVEVAGNVLPEVVGAAVPFLGPAVKAGRVFVDLSKLGIDELNRKIIFTFQSTLQDIFFILSGERCEAKRVVETEFYCHRVHVKSEQETRILSEWQFDAIIEKSKEINKMEKIGRMLRGGGPLKEYVQYLKEDLDDLLWFKGKIDAKEFSREIFGYQM